MSEAGRGDGRANTADWPLSGDTGRYRRVPDIPMSCDGRHIDLLGVVVRPIGSESDRRSRFGASVRMAGKRGYIVRILNCRRSFEK